MYLCENQDCSIKARESRIEGTNRNKGTKESVGKQGKKKKRIPRAMDGEYVYSAHARTYARRKQWEKDR